MVPLFPERMIEMKSVSPASGPNMNPREDNQLALLSQVAHMYYDLHMSQPVIAEKLYYSRSKVSRMLEKALELGVVNIHVKRYVSRNPGVEKKLEAMFHLPKAIVVNNFGEWDDEDSHEALSNYAAKYVSGCIQGEYILGITGSTEITRVVQKLTKVHPCDLQVVQTMGASIDRYNSNELMNYFSKTYGGIAHFLHAPIYVSDLYVKSMLMQDPSVSNAMQLMKRCNLILMGVGAFDLQGDMPNWYGYMTDAHREEMSRLNAVGSICAHFFDVDGNPLDCEWNEKCIAIPWADIKNAKTRVAVSSGKRKIKPVLGALRGKLVDVLITDATTASLVIEEQQKIEKKEAEKALSKQ